MRTLLGTALLAVPFLLLRKRSKPAPSRKSIALVAVSGIFLGACWLLLFEAYNLIGVGTSSLLYYCGPVLVMALSPVLFRERLTASRICAFGVVLAGIFLVNSEGLAEGLSLEGIAYAAASAVCLAAMIISNKKAEGVVGIENAFVQIASAFVTAFVGTAILHGISTDVQPSDWPAILVLGFVNTGLGCYLYFGSIGKLKTQTVAVLGYIEPVTAVVMSVVFLGEGMTALQAAGAILVIAGAAATELAPLFTRAIARQARNTPARLPVSR